MGGLNQLSGGVTLVSTLAREGDDDIDGEMRCREEYEVGSFCRD